MMLLIVSLVFIGLTSHVSSQLNSSSSSVPDSSDNKHNEHYHINKFNQLADDDRTEQHTEHTEDADDYDENDDRPEYVEEEDYYEDDEERSQGEEETEGGKEKSTTPENNKIPEESKDKNQKSVDVVTKVVLDNRDNTGNTGLKWFETDPKDKINPNQQLSRKVTPPTSVLGVTKSSGTPSNEADLQKNHNLHAKIMNIKENANRLNNEKVIYADEKFLLLKFQLTPLNGSSVQDVLNNGAEDIDSFEQKFTAGKSKHHLSGLFDSSIFDEDSKFFDDFNVFKHRTFYPERTKGNFERRYPENPNAYRSENYKHNEDRTNSLSHQKAHSPKESFFQGSKKYKSGKGVWIGNKYYPYHGPSFGKRPSRPGHHFGHGHDFSDEDSSDYSFSDCSDDYEESSEEDYGKDPGILYGQPKPGFVPTNGRYPGKGKGPGYVPTNGGDPGISNGKPVRPGYDNGLGPQNGKPRPDYTPVNEGDQGILYGAPRPGFVPTGPGNQGPVKPGNIPNDNGGDTGILYGPGNGAATPPNNFPPTTGNNSDVVFLVIASP